MVMPISKCKMGIDIDNVIADTIGINGGGICFLLNENPASVKTWDWLQCKYGRREFFEKYRTAWKEGYISPLETSGQVFTFFQEARKRKIQTDYLTAMPLDCLPYMRDWLIKNELAFARTIQVDNIQDKIALGYRYLIDDCGLIEPRPNQTLFLYDQLWNKNIKYQPYQKIHRIKRLSDAITILRKEEL